MAAMFSRWWRADQHGWLSGYLEARGISGATRVLMASIAASMGPGAGFRWWTKDFGRTRQQHSGLPVIVNGHLDDPHDAAAIVESGTADVVSLAKPALANRN
jgi:2,4-dienoyl-CoA reductase-like NADH-dependent reductase (Old Yellow Enzyme family)